MFITEALLPPKPGYVEVLDENGEHVYSATEEMTEKLAADAENKLLKAQLQAQTDRSDFIEEVIAEMATIVYV